MPSASAMRRNNSVTRRRRVAVPQIDRSRSRKPRERRLSDSQRNEDFPGGHRCGLTGVARASIFGIRVSVDDTSIEQRVSDKRLLTRVAAGRDSLSEVESKQIVDAIGISTAIARPARTADEAARLAVECGFPVALKVLSPEVDHKSDVGGVELNVTSEAEAQRAFERIRRNLAERMPHARFEGVTVQQMAPPGSKFSPA